MDSREINKLAAAWLCAAAALGAAMMAAALLVPDRAPARPAFLIAGLSSATGQAPLPPIGPRLAKASVAHGEQVVGSACLYCHAIDKGAPAEVGPNLYGVTARPVASFPDYDYSPALRQLGGRWTPERLDAWLRRPRDFAPGTRMGFPGIASDATRADAIAYLLTLSDAPGPRTP